MYTSFPSSDPTGPVRCVVLHVPVGEGVWGDDMGLVSFLYFFTKSSNITSRGTSLFGGFWCDVTSSPLREVSRTVIFNVVLKSVPPKKGLIDL